MNVVMIGTGYVGLVTGTCLSGVGNHVTCVDIDTSKLERLNRGEIPIYELGLEEMVRTNLNAGRLKFSSNVAECVPQADLVFIAVGTPQDEDGSADLKYVMGAAESISPFLSADAIVVIKSTVPVGTNRKVKNRLDELTGRDVMIASNPEFLKEGCAIDDFMRPDRVIVGSLAPQVADKLKALYAPFLRTEAPFIAMGLESAEMTKYVANCVLATKISFINEMANLCDLIGANINDVRKGIGHDPRIGFAFLNPGVGYGGSCFPKDVLALRSTGRENGYQTTILNAVDDVNQLQKLVLFNKVHRHFDGDLKGKKIAIWGLSFKPNTDDIREASSLKLIDNLLRSGADIHVHDPVAIENVRKIYGDSIHYHESQYAAIDQAEVLLIVTEWKDYQKPDFELIKSKLKSPVIFDGRNLYSLTEMAELGIQYSGIGLNPQKFAQ